MFSSDQELGRDDGISIGQPINGDNDEFASINPPEPAPPARQPQPPVPARQQQPFYWNGDNDEFTNPPEPAPPALQIHPPRIRVRHVRGDIQASDDFASLHINPSEPHVPARQPQPPVPARQPQPPVPARQPQPFNWLDLRNARLEEQRLADIARYRPPGDALEADELQQSINEQRAEVARLEEQQRAEADDPQARQQVAQQLREIRQRASLHINPPEPPVPARQHWFERQQFAQQQREQRERKEQQQREQHERKEQQREQHERKEQQQREQQQREQQQREQQREQQQREQKLPDIEAKVVLSTIEDKINHFQKKHQECQLLMNEQDKLLMNEQNKLFKDIIDQINNEHNKLLKDIIDQTNNEQEARNDKETCQICMVNKRSHVVFPCGHYCLCEVCAEEINKTTSTSTRKCPICRAVNVRFNKLYENKYLKYKMKYLKLKK